MYPEGIKVRTFTTYNTVLLAKNVHFEVRTFTTLLLLCTFIFVHRTADISPLSLSSLDSAEISAVRYTNVYDTADTTQYR